MNHLVFVVFFYLKSEDIKVENFQIWILLKKFIPEKSGDFCVYVAWKKSFSIVFFLQMT